MPPSKEPAPRRRAAPKKKAAAPSTGPKGRVGRRTATTTAATAGRGGTKEKRRLGLFDRVQLSLRVVAARNKPKPDAWQTIAKREDVPERTLRRLYNRFQEHQEVLTDPTGQQVLEETLLAFQEQIQWLSDAADDADTWSSRISAVRALSDVLKDRLELLVLMGRMPRSVQASADRQRVQRIVRRMAEVLERNGASPELISEMLSVLDEDQPEVQRALPPAA